ncbi:unnamed protein product [Laminaria digitata]
MAFAERKGHSSEEDEDESFVIELLNAQERRYGDGKARKRSDAEEAESTRHSFVRRMTPMPGASGATKDEFLGWSDGGEYARAAEAAGVDVIGMLEAGVDAQQLLEFVSNYRKEEGDKLGLMDAQNLKFATSQVLRNGPRAGAEVVFTQPSDSRPSGRGPATGLGLHTRQAPDIQLRRARAETPQTSERHLPPDRIRRGRETGAPIGGGTRHPRGGRPSEPNPGGALEEGDGAETARLCDELLRWSSTLEGAQRKAGEKGAAGVVGRRTDGKSRREEAAARVRAADVVDEQTVRVPAKDNADFEGDASCGEDEGETRRVTENGSGRPRPSRPQERDQRQQREGRGERDRRRRHRQGATEVGDKLDRSSSLELTTEWDLDERGGGSESSPGRLPREGVRGNGHARPTPSYALPTKHFKTLDSRDRRDVLYAEGGRREKEQQRQAHVGEENSALKLRLEGQRRAIHELEHQAYTLREEARVRQEELSRLKKKLAVAPSSVTGGRCSFCVSTHHARARAGGDVGASALRKRALAAEGRTQTLERHLADSKAKEQRSREIAASLKHSYSGAQEKAAGLEAELEFAKNALTEVRHQLAESRRDAKVVMKNTRKHQRQQGERMRETEIARAKAADLAVQLRKVSKEVERARLEAAGHREEKGRVEARADDLVRENRMLQDRLSDGKLRSRTRERDRWILSELRSASASPTRRSTTRAPTGDRQDRSAPHASRRRDDGPLIPHVTAPQPLPAGSPDDDAWVRASGDGPRLSRREEALDSMSGSEQPRRRRRSRSASPGGILGSSGSSEAGLERASDRLPPRSKGRRRFSDRPGDARSRAGGTGGAGGGLGVWGGAGRAVSTRSLDGVEGGVGGGGGFRSSDLSAGSAPHSNMGARYERLQAMYRRVNRKDVGSGGRVGVG